MPVVKKNILLNPGPATTTDSVKFAQVVPDICPRELEFGDLMEFISEELTLIVANPNHYTTVLFSGSGTAAVESVLSSVVDQDIVVIINNGSYGKRMCEIAEIYGLNLIEYKSSCYEAIDLSVFETFIEKVPQKISHVAIVHNETSTGLLNDLESIGQICKKNNIEMIVDGMSSFAAIPIEMSKMNISYLAASSNKNIQGMAGVSFVIAPNEKLESVKHIKPSNYYLNLYSQYKFFSQTHQMRFTPPVQTIYALKQAILELKQEGIKQRYERYSKSWETLIRGITRLGLKHLVKEKDHSKVVTAIIQPDCDGFDFNEMHDHFYYKGYTIYPGKFEEFNTFRIANMGDITYKDVEAFLDLMEEYLNEIECIRKS